MYVFVHLMMISLYPTLRLYRYFLLRSMHIRLWLKWIRFSSSSCSQFCTIFRFWPISLCLWGFLSISVIETQFCTIFGVDPCLCLWGFLYISVIESAIVGYAVSLQGGMFFQDVRGDVIYGARFKNGVRQNRVSRKWSCCRCCKVDVSTRVIKSESFQDWQSLG